MNSSFDRLTTLQYQVKALFREVEAFKSGEKYQKMNSEHQNIVRYYERQIKKLKQELAEARRETITVRENWWEVSEDVAKEHKKELQKKEREIEKLIKRNLELERQLACANEKYRNRNLEYYAVASALEEEQGKNKKLTAQVNLDFENSSIPSSMKIGRKKITNSREKTGRKPGGQPGHVGHQRKQCTPTSGHEIPAPEQYANSPDFKPTGKIIRKQKIILHTTMEVIEFYTAEYRNVKTGQRVHASFPEGYQDEVNYDGSVKAFAFLLGNECNVSHDKVRHFLSELTGNELKISKGMINGLCAEFSTKTEAEQKEVYNTLLSSPVMNTDFTNANVNGKSAQVLICAAPDTAAALFIAQEQKGHEGIKDTPVEVYQGVLVHDHDKTFYSYGLNHQECMQHNIRYLKGSEENEPELTWNQGMHTLVKEMLHYRNGLGDEEALDAQMVTRFEERYDKILKKAEQEYEDSPPGDYYREGYNLYMRLVKYKQNELLFLHDKRVPSNNSLCERLARVYKRKQKQVMAMRSFENLRSLCNSMSMIYLLRNREENLYQKVSSIYERKRLPKEKKITGAL